MDPELRRDRLGGSEVAVVFNAHEYLTAFGVAAMKKGALKPDPPNIRMIVGKACERGILDLYTYVTGREVEYSDQTFVHPTRRYMAATPDAFVKGERRGVDAKLVFWDQRGNWGDTADEIPHRVVIQCYWYMAAFDFDLWDVCALVGMDDPRIYTIERNLEAEKAMLARAEEWHARYILGDEMPPMDCSAEAARWLQAIYPNHKTPDLRDADETESLLLDTYLELRLKQKELSTTQAEMETMLKAAIKDREGLRWGDGRFTWRKQKGRTDWKSLAISLLYEFIKDETLRAERQEFYVGEGTRRIRLDHPLWKEARENAKEKEVTV
jgi:predicted phage-related endonuclease